MLTTAARRGMVLALLCSGAAACERRAKPANTERADAPAVVKVPPLVLASDTAKPDTMQAHADRVNLVRTTLATNYSVLGAATVFGDRRMIASIYAPDAELSTPDSLYRGLAAIANALAALGPPKSLRSFDRMSRTLRIVDSTVIDSGTYVMVSARAGTKSVVDRGSYVSRWRIRPAPAAWVLTYDQLRQSATQPKRGG
jgi:hypothetical protein